MTELRPNNPPTKEAESPDKPNLYEGVAKIALTEIEYSGREIEPSWNELNSYAPVNPNC